MEDIASQGRLQQSYLNLHKYLNHPNWLQQNSRNIIGNIVAIYTFLNSVRAWCGVCFSAS
jgi:hypothetical protein